MEESRTMHRLTRDRIAWALGPFLVGLALGGSRIRATSASERGALPAASAPDPLLFAYDLENVQPHPPRDPRGQLRLVAEPVRVGWAGLLVRVEVWNPSVEDRLVHPIYPSVYQLSFRDTNGKPVEVYTLPTGSGVIQNLSEFALISYKNCLSASYLLPTFYNRIRKRDLECRVQIGTVYNLNAKGDRATFELTSNWVKVPRR